MITDKKVIANISELKAFVSEFINSCSTKVVLLNGEIGAGKTTFVSQIKDIIGIIDDISSPTFSIINRYVTQKNENIYHVDLYRLDDIYELEMAGFYDILSGGDYRFIFIEWSDKFNLKSELASFTAINIDVNDSGGRVITTSTKV